MKRNQPESTTTCRHVGSEKTIKVDLLLVVDHLSAECGVRYTYLKFIEWCDSAGISLAVISDIGKELSFRSVKAELSVIVQDLHTDYPLKRRPMYSLIKDGKVIHKNLNNHQIGKDGAQWLDAWNGDRSWFSQVKHQCEVFLERINPNKVLIATQSFLGFVLETLLRDSNPNICLHTHYSAFYAIRIARFENELFSVIQNAAKDRIFKHFIDKKNNLFLNSKSSMSFFTTNNKEFNYQIFTPGVDISLFKPDYASNKKRARLRVLYTGRFSREKGIDSLEKLIHSTPFVNWILAGEIMGNLSLEFPKNSTYLGFLDQSKLAKEMARSDLFVFFGQWDTFGMVALEALSCGVPVFATRGSEIGRIVEANDCGWTFSSTQELLGKMEMLSKDGIPISLNMNARSYAEKMTWEKTFSDFSEKLRL